MAKALFERVGDRFLPTELSLGPWSPNALHGGPTAALLARAIERFRPEEAPSAVGGAPVEGMFVARITLELLRPVPLAPLEVRTRLLRPGRNVQLIEATLASAEHEVARATGLRIRLKDVHLPPNLPMAALTIAPPETGEEAHQMGEFLEGFHSRALEHRFVRGQLSTPGHATDWLRLLVPLLEDEEPSPLSRVCAAADFGNGASSILPKSHTYINADLTVYLHRYPRGEWVCIDAVTRVEEHGIGLAESQLFDRDGPIGRAAQSLIIQER